MDELGNVVEVFSAIQGEGVHVGRRHVFVRLAGCAFGCAYCDQPEARQAPANARLYPASGGEPQFAPNPMSAAAVAREAIALDRPAGLHHAFSVTGGEPLEQPAFLERLLPLLADAAPKIMLETHGAAPEALARVVRWVDIVAMDYKARSATGRPTPREAHQRFLDTALGREIYVKVVVAATTSESEVVEAARCVARADRRIPLVIQPATPRSDGVARPEPELLLRLHAAAAAELEDVRVIPQTHPLMDMR